MGRLLPIRVGPYAFVVIAVCLGATAVTRKGATEDRRKVPAASQRVIHVLQGIEQELRETKYQGVTRVDRSQGRYLFDCSGMAAWVLRRSAPAALRSMGRPDGHRPLAVHYYRKIAKIPLGKRRGPWQRVRSAAHARPGDVIAWKRPKWFESRSTGHVAFVLSTPKVNPGPVRGLLLARVY